MKGLDRNLPTWVNVGLLPLLNVVTALLVSALVFWLIDVNPLEAAEILLYGAFGYQEGIGFTLYYTTNFIFTGLAVAIAFHVGLFNIGGEGQAYIGGLGVGLLCLALDASVPGPVLLLLSTLAAALFGAAWAFIPGWLQAYRGSHIVITTIMFNFLASSLMVYLMVNVLREPGQMAPQSRALAETAWLPFMHDLFAAIGIEFERSPLNISLFLALLCAFGAWVFIWKTKWGYEIRTVGSNQQAAVYAGIKPARVMLLAMAISGALAGFVGVNEINGVQHRLLLDFHYGYGFAGIAVALMGRNHPIGIVLAALLFGALYQGGAELAFEMSNVNRDIVVVMQGLVILFCGALEFLYKPLIANMFKEKTA
ncbi:ABC transporter permease [Hahella sp. KA22]|uniref:ABC transporter permease n=1 Tax=Hahella sp. KA22 TaxID=1628392 RepID=UPI000FDE8703|nr:ABC transporter permease [Hahella sp. KA22]AZZ91607.1 ABC transporter permease [Hahella sp. KA22]QAY54977.1 ABC transporter permease [Hahella sp. KA22]